MSCTCTGLRASLLDAWPAIWSMRHSHAARVMRAVWHVVPAVPTLVLYHRGHSPPNLAVGAAAVAWSLAEAVRLRQPALNARLRELMGSGMRTAEMSRPTGTFFYLWGVVLTLMCFHPDAAVAGILCLALADPAAAFAGQAMGPRFRGPALREGKSVGGFVVAWAVASLAVFIHMLTLRDGIAGSSLVAPWVGLCAAVAESFSPMDDNFALPLVSAACASMWPATRG